MSKLFLLSCLTLFFQSTGLHAASFDCKKASTAIEKAICKDNNLNVYDERLAYAYKQLLKSDKNAAAGLKEEQRKWVKDRNQQCTDGNVECLSKLYGERVETLESNLVDSASTKSKSGCDNVYLFPHLAGLPTEGKPGELKPGIAENSLTVDQLDKDHISFYLSTIGTNAHMCTLMGVAKKQGDAFQWQSTQAPNDEGKQCSASIQLWEKGQYATLDIPDDVATVCHQWYCGMRAYLSRAGEVYTVASNTAKKDCSAYKFSYR